MRAILYSRTGDPEVLTLTEIAEQVPGAGEVQIAFHRSGVNPADWRGRRGAMPGLLVDPPRVPGNDGSGVVHAIGEGVPESFLGARVWVWEAVIHGAGSAQELAVITADKVAVLPDSASFDLGAILGVPFLTAHRCLTVNEDGPTNLGPGALSGRTVLVAGGAGAVGNAAIQLASWSGATVIATVSSSFKAQLAEAAGADHIIDYTERDAASEIRKIAPSGIDTIVEVAPVANAQINGAVLAAGGTLAVYSTDGGLDLPLPFSPLMMSNARLQFVMVFGIPESAKYRAVADVCNALESGAIGAGIESGLPIHHFDLANGPAAHAAVEAGAIGKVLIDIR